MFEILNLTSATLTSFTGRTETHGKNKVPAVSIRLKFTGANTMLDLLSKDIRHTLYMAAEGQEDLPGVEPVTPLLRCKDIKTWSPENCYEGWTVTIEHGIDDESGIEMGGCKIDAFACELFDGGTVAIECRVSSSDLDWMSAGRLWSRQQSEVKVMLAAPLTPSTNPEAGLGDERQMTLDVTTGNQVGEMSTERAAAEAAFYGDATDTFIEQHAGDGGSDDDEDDPDPEPAPPARTTRAVAAKYRDPKTGQTWSGRGLKPKWLVAALEAGWSLFEFDMAAN